MPLRWICVAVLLGVGSLTQAADVVFVPGRTVDGSIDSRSRLQLIHREMKRECGASPGSSRCERLKREFQQEAKNVRKQRRK
jgi:hypothetical protein